MPSRIDLNADLGESFGRWTLGDDAALMPHLTSANVACGFHGGDPHVLRRTVALAVEHGVGIGAHVGLPDLVGFGRRRMAVSPEELGDLVLYQAGAVRAFAEAAGAELRHVKPHGALYSMVAEDDELARALCEAVAVLGVALLMPPQFGPGGRGGRHSLRAGGLRRPRLRRRREADPRAREAGARPGRDGGERTAGP